MIALLVGRPIVTRQSLILMTGGVGYGVMVGARTLSSIGDQSEITLYVHTHVREDALDLFGFTSFEDKEMFHLLLSVSGVGPKTALAITDLGAEKIVQAVQTADVSLFSLVPRVGKKLAQKIIIELKPKLGSLQELNLGPRSAVEQDVVDALSALGFSDAEIHVALQSLELDPSLSVSVLVTQAIKIMGSRATHVNV